MADTKGEIEKIRHTKSLRLEKYIQECEEKLESEISEPKKLWLKIEIKKHTQMLKNLNA